MAQISKAMKIEKEKIDDLTLKVRFTGFPGFFINAIRRRIINSVETASIDEVEIIKNTSGLYDEMIAHRLGMIPFTFNKEIFASKDSKVKFVLKAEGEKMVYSGEIKTTHEDFKPLYDDIPIVKLLDLQEIDIEGTIKLGNGKEHAKFIPAIVGMKEIEEDNIYELTIESISALSPEEILKEALSKINIEVKEWEKLFK